MRAHGRDGVSMFELSSPSSTDVHQLERDWALRLRAGPAECATQIQTGPQGSATLTRPPVPARSSSWPLWRPSSPAALPTCSTRSSPPGADPVNEAGRGSLAIVSAWPLRLLGGHGWSRTAIRGSADLAGVEYRH